MFGQDNGLDVNRSNYDTTFYYSNTSLPPKWYCTGSQNAQWSGIHIAATSNAQGYIDFLNGGTELSGAPAGWYWHSGGWINFHPSKTSLRAPILASILTEFASYFGYPSFSSFWDQFGEPYKALRHQSSAMISNLKTYIATANSYPADLATWKANREAYYAAMVTAQAVTSDQTLIITPATLEELYRSFEYTYDWNVFSTITTGSSNISTFDSRLKPLVVVSGGSITAPATPVSAGSPTDSGEFTGTYYDEGIQRWYWSGASFGGGSAPGIHQNDWDFKSADFSSSSPITTGLTQNNLMFAAPSLTQAVQVRTIRGYSEHELPGWYFSSDFPYYLGSYLEGIQRQHSISTWWAMYLNAFKIENNSFKSGWATYDVGFEYSANWTAGAVGFFPWDDDEEAGTVIYGSVPYEPKTINRKPNMYIITDASKYT
jgi:hypothetical protein